MPKQNRSEVIVNGTTPFNPNPLPIPDKAYGYVIHWYSRIMEAFDKYADEYWRLFERHLDYDFRHMGLALPYEKEQEQEGGCNG